MHQQRHRSAALAIKLHVLTNIFGGAAPWRACHSDKKHLFFAWRQIDVDMVVGGTMHKGR